MAFQKHGFDLIDNHEEQITENMHLAILELLNNNETIEKEFRCNLNLCEFHIMTKGTKSSSCRVALFND